MIKSPGTQEQLDKQLAADMQAIQMEVANITFAWGHMETTLVILLGTIIKDNSADVASAIYFTPAGLEIRGNIVSNALDALLIRSALHDCILAKWQVLANTMNRLRKTRNKIAHGQLVTFSSDKLTCVRLASPALKRDDAAIAAFRGGQKPGMGQNEIRQSVRAVNKARKAVEVFIEIVALFHKDDVSTLLQKLAALEVQSPNQPDLDNQTP